MLFAEGDIRRRAIAGGLAAVIGVAVQMKEGAGVAIRAKWQLLRAAQKGRSFDSKAKIPGEYAAWRELPPRRGSAQREKQLLHRSCLMHSVFGVTHEPRDN